MNEKALKVLEYEKIIQKLTELAGSAPGKALCRALAPQTELPRILQLQRETSDAVNMLLRKGQRLFFRCDRPERFPEAPGGGSSLGVEELLRLCRLLGDLLPRESLVRGETGQEEETSLSGMFQNLQPLTPLSAEIRRCIPSEEEIDDNASPGLRQVRRQMQAYQRADPFSAYFLCERFLPGRICRTRW